MMDHFARRFWDGQPSLLAQLYGAFRVEHRSGRLGPRVSTHYIVFENIGDDSLHGFDLKGTKRSAKAGRSRVSRILRTWPSSIAGFRRTAWRPEREASQVEEHEAENEVL